MHPTDPLKRAMNKAWIEFASQMLGAQYRYCVAPSEEIFNQSLEEMRRLIAQLENRLGDGPYFNGKEFCLIDAAFAPFFIRTELLESHCNNDLYKDAPKVAAWAEKLVTKDSVINSVKPDFAEKYMAYILNAKTYASQVFSQNK